MIEHHTALLADVKGGYDDRCASPSLSHLFHG